MKGSAVSYEGSERRKREVLSDEQIEEIAERAGTIPYTLLTGVTPRVRIVELGAEKS